MPGSHHEDILHRVIDGEAVPEEVGSLRDLLERNPTLRRRYDRLVALTSALQELGTVEPPPKLRDEVLRAIRQPRRRPSWLDSIRTGLQRRRFAREGLVFAGGMLVGMLVLLGIRGEGPPLSRDDLVGTMAQPAAGLDRRSVARIPVEFDGVEGSVQTFSSSDGVLVDVDLQASHEILVVLGFDARSWQPAAVRQTRPTARGIEIHPDRILLRHVGQNQYRVYLQGDAEAGTPLRVEISSENDWFEDTLATHERRP